MGMLETAENWLRTQRRASLSKTVTYRRGGVSNASVPATQAETRGEADNGEVILESRTVDWLIDRADLTLSGSATEPLPGDRIEVTYDHGTETFEVAAVGTEPAWRWHGRDGGTFRIHTVTV